MAISLAYYNNLQQLETCKVPLKEHDSLFNNDSDSNMADLSNFNYYDNHECHKLCNKPPFKAEHKTGILHTNIFCSISKISKHLKLY